MLTSLKSSLRRLPSWIYICVSLKLSSVWSSYHAWRALCSLVSLSLSLSPCLYPPWLNIAKWFSHSHRIAAALLESIRPADLWPSLMYVYPFLLTLHCAKTPTRSWYPGKCSNLLPTPPFPLSRYPLLAAPRPVINKWLPWEGTRKLKLQKRKTSSRY